MSRDINIHINRLQEINFIYSLAKFIANQITSIPCIKEIFIDTYIIKASVSKENIIITST